MDAISSDENGKANITMTSVFRADNALSTVLCVIADKSQIFQTIRAIQSGEKVYVAAVQICWTVWSKSYSWKATCSHEGSLFADVFEVAIGRPLCQAGGRGLPKRGTG